MRYTSGLSVSFDCSNESGTDRIFKDSIPSLKDGGAIIYQTVKLDLYRILVVYPHRHNIRQVLNVLTHSIQTDQVFRWQFSERYANPQIYHESTFTTEWPA